MSSTCCLFLFLKLPAISLLSMSSCHLFHWAPYSHSMANLYSGARYETGTGHLIGLIAALQPTFSGISGKPGVPTSLGIALLVLLLLAVKLISLHEWKTTTPSDSETAVGTTTALLLFPGICLNFVLMDGSVYNHTWYWRYHPCVIRLHGCSLLQSDY